MSLADSLSVGGRKRLTVSVSEIRVNKKNHYKIEDIDLLAKQILEKGQLSNGIVYEKNEGDGKKYTLLGGERRYTAILNLYNKHQGNGKMEVIVMQEPIDEWEEKRLIRFHNSQREKDSDDYYRDIKDAEEEYGHLDSIGQKPNGLKRDWIGKEVGLSGRRVDDYLKLRKESLSPQVISENNSNDAKSELKSNEKSLYDVKKLVTNSKKTLEKALKLTEQLHEYQYDNEINHVILSLQQLIKTFNGEK